MGANTLLHYIRQVYHNTDGDTKAPEHGTADVRVSPEDGY